jgi:hypothetical protein
MMNDELKTRAGRNHQFLRVWAAVAGKKPDPVRTIGLSFWIIIHPESGAKMVKF